MYRSLVIANWKMNTNLADAVFLTNAVKNKVGNFDIDVVLCPPSVWLVPMNEILDLAPKNIYLGAQNIWFVAEGAVTGEISAFMLKGIASYVILGHSERRNYFKETNELINDKVKIALKNGLTPIVCVGEAKKFEEKMSEKNKGRGRPNAGDVKADVIFELQETIKGLSVEQIEKIVIAYEPVWAISSSGEGPATGAYASQVIEKMREFLAETYNKSVSERVRILYGGSVDEDNVKEYIYQPEIDGVLVGGASLNAKRFIGICKEASGKE